MLSCSCAHPHPDGVRPQYAAQLAAAWRVAAIPGPQPEVLRLGRPVVIRVPLDRIRSTGAGYRFGSPDRSGEAIIRIWPRGLERRIVPRRADTLGELG
jgi:hypothetical protein